MKFNKPITHSRGVQNHLDYLAEVKNGCSPDDRKIVFDSSGLYDHEQISGYYDDIKKSHHKYDPEKHPNAAYSATLSLDPKDPIARRVGSSDELMTEIGHKMASRLCPGHQYLIAIHRDQPHPHIHLVWAAIATESGKLYHRDATDFYDAKRNFTKLIQEEYGLSRLDFLPEGQKSPERQTDGEHFIRQSGGYVWKDDLKSRIERARQGDPSEFQERLAGLGVTIREKKYKGKPYQTYNFMDLDGAARVIKTSKLGTAFAPEVSINAKSNQAARESLAKAKLAARDLPEYRDRLWHDDILALGAKREPGKLEYYHDGGKLNLGNDPKFSRVHLEKRLANLADPLRNMQKAIKDSINSSSDYDGLAYELASRGVQLSRKDDDLHFTEKKSGFNFSAEELGPNFSTKSLDPYFSLKSEAQARLRAAFEQLSQAGGVTSTEERLRQQQKYVWKDDLRDRIEDAANDLPLNFVTNLRSEGVEVFHKSDKLTGAKVTFLSFQDAAGNSRTIRAVNLGDGYAKMIARGLVESQDCEEVTSGKQSLRSPVRSSWKDDLRTQLADAANEGSGNVISNLAGKGIEVFYGMDQARAKESIYLCFHDQSGATRTIRAHRLGQDYHDIVMRGLNADPSFIQQLGLSRSGYVGGPYTPPAMCERIAKGLTRSLLMSFIHEIRRDTGTDKEEINKKIVDKNLGISRD